MSPSREETVPLVVSPALTLYTGVASGAGRTSASAGKPAAVTLAATVSLLR